MKKSLAFALTALAVVGAAVGGAFTQKAHDENKFSYPWDSASANTDSDAPDQTISSASGSLSAKVSGGTVFGANGIRKSVAKGATKTVTFTVSPATATDKYVVVATSDATKVSVSSTKVLSGTAVTLTLANGEFNGTVSITAHPEALPTSVVTIPVTVYNFVRSLSIEACVITSDAPGNVYQDYSGKGNPVDAEVDDGSSAYYGGVYVSAEDQFGTIVAGSPHYGVSGNERAYAMITAYARDVSAAPGAGTSKPSWALDASLVGGTQVVYTVELNTTAGTALSYVFEDASLSVATRAYVAPSGLAGDVGGVQFK